MSIKTDHGHLQKVLGSGGMGVVWRAHDQELGRDVAIKLLKLEADASEKIVKRFIQEARIPARLKHPGIVEVHDLGQDGDLVFIVMELVRGRELKHYLGLVDPLPVEWALWITRQITQALEYAHSYLVHRDLKPANVMVTQDGYIKICDFGIAKPIHDLSGSPLTRTGQQLGTPAYMSPEQAKSQAVDHRSDLYSLGCVVYELLTGSRPFKSDNHWGMLHAHINVRPVPPRRHRDDIPEDFNNLVLRLLAKNPEDRPADASAVLDLVDRIEQAAPGPVVTPQPWPGPPGRPACLLWTSRNTFPEADNHISWNHRQREISQAPNAVVVANGEKITALHPTLGWELWQVDDDRGYSWHTTVTEEMLYLAGGLTGWRPGDSFLVSRDSVSGDEKWARSLDVTPRSAPLVVDEVVVCSLPGNRPDGPSVHVFDASTGERLWAIAGQAHTILSRDEAPSLLYITDSKNRLHAYEADSAQREWSCERVDGVALGGDKILVTNWLRDKLTVYSATSGTRLWEIGWLAPSHSALAFGADAFYVADSEGKVVSAFAVHSEVPLWTREAGEPGIAELAFHNGLLFVRHMASQGTRKRSVLRALDPTNGDPVWELQVQVRVGDHPHASVTQFSGDTLYYFEDDHVVAHRLPSAPHS
ncbi:protein kinase [Actinomadura sp. 6N118]|uniref:serine/threonine-protein kinase n=1 Tax=Actinomadura sp. 6N118 TaxID=3375151 RepID=UPI003793B2A0